MGLEKRHLRREWVHSRSEQTSLFNCEVIQIYTTSKIDLTVDIASWYSRRIKLKC